MFRIINKLKNRKGFTLIELIVVLAVLAIILAIAVPRFMGVRDQAKKDADASTVTSIAKLAELEYVKDNRSGAYTYNASASALFINANFPGGNVFQDATLESNKNNVDIVFDSNGKVTTVKVGDKTFTNNNGKFE